MDKLKAIGVLEAFQRAQENVRHSCLTEKTGCWAMTDRQRRAIVKEYTENIEAFKAAIIALQSVA